MIKNMCLFSLLLTFLFIVCANILYKADDFVSLDIASVLSYNVSTTTIRKILKTAFLTCSTWKGEALHKTNQGKINLFCCLYFLECLFKDRSVLVM